MTSACIFKDTLRNNTQVFFKFGDCIFEICLHLINSNCISYFLPSSMLSSGAETSKDIPLNNSEVSLTSKPISLSYSFLQVSCSIKKFIQPRFFNSTWHLTLQLIRRSQTYSLWNKSPMSPVHNDTTPRTSVTRLNYRRIKQQGCPQLLRLHFVVHK